MHQSSKSFNAPAQKWQQVREVGLMTEPVDTAPPVDLSAPYRRARALLAEMFVGKWSDDIPAELRREAGLILFGHDPDGDQLP